MVYDDIPPEFAVYGPGPNVVYLVTFAIDWPHSFTNVTEKVRNEFPAISHMEISYQNSSGSLCWRVFTLLDRSLSLSGSDRTCAPNLFPTGGKGDALRDRLSIGIKYVPSAESLLLANSY